MSKKISRATIMVAAGCGALALAFGGASARAEEGEGAGATRTTTETGSINQPGGRTAAQLTTTSAKVTNIDRAARTVTLKGPSGGEMTVSVPPDLKAYDRLKVGDTVDVDYYQSVAVSLLPPGSKASVTEQTGRTTGMGGATTGKVITVAAEVVAVDPVADTVTFKGPQGRLKTVAVQDPQLQSKLSEIKPGQMVQFRYQEALATDIRPSEHK